MTANELLMLLPAFLAGMVLGAFFFAGLWWTIRKGVSFQNPALWFLGSMVIRMGVVVGGFYLVADGQWERLIACLAGFIVARTVILRLKKFKNHDA